MTLFASIFILYVCILSVNNVDVSKLCMDHCMADKSSVYCLGPNVVSCYKSTEEQRLNHRDRSCKTFGWIGSECTCYAPEIGWFVENMASKLPKMWSENGRMNHGKRWWASPGCNHLSGDCWLRGSVDCRKPAAGHTLQTPPNVHLHATDPPTVRPLSDYLYTAELQNVRAHGAEQTP